MFTNTTTKIKMPGDASPEQVEAIRRAWEYPQMTLLESKRDPFITLIGVMSALNLIGVGVLLWTLGGR